MIFVNSRRLAERLAAALNEIAESDRPALRAKSEESLDALRKLAGHAPVNFASLPAVPGPIAGALRTGLDILLTLTSKVRLNESRR